jgi:hypothetical protein
MVRFARQHAWPSPTPGEIIRRARILVIDDSDFPYLRLFKKDGYNIDKWSDVEDPQSLRLGVSILCCWIFGRWPSTV